MPIKFEEDADDNKFYASFGIPISQVKLAVDWEHVHIPDTKPPQFWPDYLSFESEPITFEVKLEGDIVGHWTRITGMSLAPSAAANLNERIVLNKEKTEMKMSEKMAVRLHRMMWIDMLEELGDNPTPAAREQFKRNWIEENFPDVSVDCSCFLCEYAWQKSQETMYSKSCNTYCPIMWNANKPGAPNSCTRAETTGISYTLSPISEILALPARNPEYDEKSRPSDYFRGYRSCLDNLARIANDPSGTFKTATDAYTHIYSKGKGEAHISKEAFDGMKRALAEASGKPENATISEHIEGIRNVEDRCSTLAKDITNGVINVAYNSTMDKLYTAAGVKYDPTHAGYSVDQLIAKIRKAGYDSGSSEKQEELNKAYEAVGKVRNEFDSFMRRLSNESGLRRDLDVGVHVEAIKKKSYDRGFENGKEEGAKETMDKIMNAFKK